MLYPFFCTSRTAKHRSRITFQDEIKQQTSNSAIIWNKKMKIILLLVAIGVANAGNCGLKYQTITTQPCSHYVSMTGINGKDPLTLDQFKELNSDIDCNQDVPAGKDICLRKKRECEVTTISEGGKTCSQYLEMTAINGRKPFTNKQFKNFNRDITCDNPDTDIIPDGKEICLRLQNPCGKTVLSTGQKKCKHYIRMSTLNDDEPLTQAEFQKLNPNIRCDNPNDIIEAGQEICVYKKRRCHMSVQAVGDKPCKDYLALTTINGKDPLTKEQFSKLNPDLECEEPETDIIPNGKEVCLRIQRPCGLTVKAEEGKTCNDYIEMSGADGKRRKLTDTEFANLNPTIDCTIPIGEGAAICLYTKSQFDNPEVQDGTTLEAFVEAAGPLVPATQFGQELFDFLSGLLNKLTQRRRKREATDDLDKDLAAKLANPENVASIKSVLEKNNNFKVLEEEYQTWRPQMCKEIKGENEYKNCVCDESKPYIHCQAILTNEKEKIDKRAKREASQFVNDLKFRFARGTGKKKGITDFIDFLTKKGGCADMERCMSHTCFSHEGCAPVPFPPPPAHVFEICIEGEACIPSLLDMAVHAKDGYLPINLFKETKLGLKVGFCLRDFPGLNVLQWLGLEKCLASIAFEYYLLKSQLDVSGQIALVVVRAALTAKIQLTKSFSKGIGEIPFFVADGYKGDICDHDKHKCEDYCAMNPGDFGIGYKLEWWFFKWRPWKEGSLKDAVPKSEKCPGK